MSKRDPIHKLDLIADGFHGSGWRATSWRWWKRWRAKSDTELARNEEFTQINSRPNHDAIIARIRAHRDEVKALRARS